MNAIGIEFVIAGWVMLMLASVEWLNVECHWGEIWVGRRFADVHGRRDEHVLASTSYP